MKQVLQVLGTGEIRVAEVPRPQLEAGSVLVRTAFSVVSVGTDRTQVEFGRKTMVGKALEKPEKVRQVLQSVARDGVRATRERVQRKLSDLVAFGYSSAGIVEAVGSGVTDLRAGDRVACAGAGHASHAEQVCVPRNLVARVPDGVPLEQAAFGTMGAIALQGVRQADVRLGETVVVIGLGLLGQLTMQLVRAAGARPIGIDVSAERVEVARAFGATALRRDDVEGLIRQVSGGVGADAVIITASTSSDDPLRLAGGIARDRGRVVVVGLVPLEAPRATYYAKELELRLSRSYGPGRYDPAYEEKGVDYPIGYVRWTENRNLEEFLRLIGAGAVSLEPLVTHRFPLEQAARAYDSLSAESGAGALGVVLEYGPASAEDSPRIEVAAAARGRARTPGRVGVGVIGAGSFATDTILPILDALDVERVGIVSARGVSARAAAERHAFRYAASEPETLLDDPGIDAIIIATRHADHARLAARALQAGKAVYVEKPLALDEPSLDEVLAAARAGGPLAVGFNRRFAPATRLLMDGLAATAGARVIQIRVNAGALPASSWVHDPSVGGGRLIGEGCHFVDLALHLAGSAVASATASGLGAADPDARLRDNFTVVLRFADGGLATILYTSKGDTTLGKERIEVFAGGATGIIDDFRRAEFRGRRTRRWRGRSDKGHRESLAAFFRSVSTGGAPPIPLAELEASSRTVIRAAAALGAGRPEAPTAAVPVRATAGG